MSWVAGANADKITAAEWRLQQAIEDPEFMLKNWIELPRAVSLTKSATHRLSLKDAILLSLRYNPNIQNAALDRVMQRYQLRLANNAFELQYALGATGVIQKTYFNGVGNKSTYSGIASPEVNWKSALGTQANLHIENNVNENNNFNPTLNFSLTQPLLRGFGRTVNEAVLQDAKEADRLNQLGLKQLIADQITTVITDYRALI